MRELCLITNPLSYYRAEKGFLRAVSLNQGSFKNTRIKGLNVLRKRSVFVFDRPEKGLLSFALRE